LPQKSRDDRNILDLFLSRFVILSFKAVSSGGVDETTFWFSFSKTPSKRRAFQRDLSSQKAQSILKIKLESFGPDERLNLCFGPSGLSILALLWIVWPQEESAYRSRYTEAFKPKGWLLARALGPFWSDVS